MVRSTSFVSEVTFMALSFKEYSLNEAGIEAVSADLQTFLARQNMEKRSMQRFRLA